MIAATALMLFSCGKTELSCFLLKTTDNGVADMEFVYTSNQLTRINRYTSSAPYGLDRYYEINRNTGGSVDFADERTNAGHLQLRNKCVYDAQGRLVSIIQLHDNDQNGYPETYGGRTDFFYDSLGYEIDSTVAYDQSNNVLFGASLIWTNGNITRVNRTADYVAITYDNHEGIYFPIRWDYFAATGDLVKLSANNLLSVTYYDWNNNPLGPTVTRSYTYDSDHGVPLSDDVGVSYEYSCN